MPPLAAQSVTSVAAAPADLRPRITRLRRGKWLQLLTPDGFEWNRVDLPVPRLPPPLLGLRILHLTDLHMRPAWCQAYDELIERVAASPPDLLLITGDIIDDRFDHRPTLPFAERLLSRLSARLGVYSILGNHDGDLIGPNLAGWGVQLLSGRIARLRSDDAEVELIGMPGVYRDDPRRRFLRSIQPRRREALRVVLAHFPDDIHGIAAAEPDLVLAGHTHGGQVCLPNGWPPIRHDSLPRRYAKGVHRWNDTWLVVARGMGFTRYRVRLFCPSEVIELSLRLP